MTFSTKKNKNEQGISLLIVLLVGTLLLFTSLAIGQYALRMVNAIRARSEATQTLYTAEQTFECVKYWLRKDYKHFSAIDGGLNTAQCNGTTYDFTTTPHSDTAGGTPTYTVTGGTVGVATFRILYDPANPNGGGVTVEVERSDVSKKQFDGVIRVYSQSNKASATQTSERFQEYKYRVVNGADIVFVVDVSGSIDDGGDRTDRISNNEWNAMLNVVNSSIRTLSLKVPAPYIGLLSFGTSPLNTGSDDGTSNGLLPDVPLMDTVGNMNLFINDNATAGDITDDVPRMKTNPADTNLSLGIAIAGADLMGKYYPYDGVPGTISGTFEAIVASGGTNFSSLPAQPIVANVGDRDDLIYPDVMVVITDGAPNGIMTHIQSNWDESTVDNLNRFFTASNVSYDKGEAKIFRSANQTGSTVVIDDKSDQSVDLTWPSTEYQTCNDSTTDTPFDVLQDPNDVDPSDVGGFPPRVAMCNATLIAEALKANDITIIAILVSLAANPETTIEAKWLKQDFVSDVGGDKLFEVVTNYQDVEKALLGQFEKLNLVQSR